MKLRIAKYCVLGIVLLGLIIGTFFDLSISQTLVKDTDNYFLHSVSGFGLVIPYMFFALFGGLLVRITIINKEQKAWLKTILIIAGILFYFAGTYFVAHDNFTVNGLNQAGIEFEIIRYTNGALICALMFVIGYISGKGNRNKRLWIAILVVATTIICSQVFGTTVLKSFFHRPRYRSLGGDIEFHPWYIPFSDYKNHLSETMTSEEFKSFPSGHASVSALMMFYAVVIPAMFPRKIGKKYCFPMFLVGFAYFVFIALVRILAGAHFLSDVSFGGLLTLSISFIGLWVIDKFKLLGHQKVED